MTGLIFPEMNATYMKVRKTNNIFKILILFVTVAE
jgi:hypothetical protein